MKAKDRMLKALIRWGLALLLIFVFVSHAIAQTCVQPPPGIVSWWAAEGNANDLQGNNPGTLYGATFAPGKVGQAFSFDGVNDRVEAPSSATLNITGPLTIDAWFKLTGPYSFNNSPIIAKWGNTDNGTAGYGLFLLGAGYAGVAVPNPDRKIAFLISSTGSDIIAAYIPYQYPFDEWHYLAGVYDGEVVKLYVDGMLIDEEVYNGSIHMTPASLTIGGYWAGYSQGLIDEAEIFNRALSDSEVLSIFNAGSAGKCERVNIDIKPGSVSNKVDSKGKGKISVAILSTDTFSAPDVLDLNSLTFGPTGNEDSLAFCDAQNVNRDGLMDLVCYFYTRNTGFHCGDTQGVLKGKTLRGIPIEGSDSVKIAPCK
jgi:hypothetical protein